MIPYEKLCSIIDESVELGADVVCFSGGEPFLHSDFAKIVEYAYKKGVNTYVYTSGIYFDGNKFTSIPQDYLVAIKSYVTKIIINYEAADAETYDKIMGTNFGGFKLMHESIKKCVSLGYLVEAHIVPLGLNYLQIPQIVSQCFELGVSRVSFLRLVMQGRSMQNKDLVSLSNEQLQQAKRLILECEKEYHNKIRIGIPLSDAICRINCHAGTSKLNIRYDGNVYPCEAFKSNCPKTLISAQPGNIYDNKLKEIYFNSLYLTEIRSKIDEFRNTGIAENCINQYYRKLSNEQ